MGIVAHKISVVIPAFSTDAEMAGGLATIEAQINEVLEVIIVDDGSNPPLTIPSWAQGIRIEREPGWRNPAPVLNLGIKKALGSEIIICQAGLYLPSTCFKSFKNNRYFGHRDFIVIGRRIDVPEPPTTLEVGVCRPAIRLDLALSMINRQRFLDLDGFDEEAFRSWGFEGQDFLLRFIISGGWIAPDDVTIAAFHVVHPSPRDKVQAQAEFMAKWDQPYHNEMILDAVKERWYHGDHSHS